MVFTLVTIVFLPMSFIASVFTIPVRDFPHENGQLSIPFSYVSKIMFGIGLGISIPLIAVAFAVDNLGLLIKRTLQSLFCRRPSPRASVSKRRASMRTSDSDDFELKVVNSGRRSGDTYRRRLGYETDNGSDLVTRSVSKALGYPRPISWRDSTERPNGIRASGDLERGVSLSQRYERGLI